MAIAKAVEDAHPVRFVHVGGASREENIELSGAALRSSAIQLMGSGVKSVPFPKLLGSISNVFDAVAHARFQIATNQSGRTGSRAAATAAHATSPKRIRFEKFCYRL